MMNFRQTVKLSQIEGALYALMVASTESFLFYFAVKQNISSLELALLSTAPLALGAISQLMIPKLISDKYLSNSVVWAMLVQIIGVLGILHTVISKFNFLELLFFTSIHFIGGLTSTPLWIDWASKIIPKRNFRKYMASRSSFSWYLILLFYILWACLGQLIPHFNLVIIFLVGAIARILSCILQSIIINGKFSKAISRKNESNHQAIPRESIHLHKMPNDIYQLIWTFIIWTSVFRLAVQVSGPFFVPYMMNDLKLSMIQFVVLTSIPYFGRALYFNYWGAASKNFGAFFGIKLTTLYISFIPIIWILTRQYSVLIITEIVAGIFWGGLELNQVLMIQNFMHPRMKDGPRILLGIHMALTNICGVIGALFGSYLFGLNFSFKQVFLLSSVLRFLTVFILIFKIKKFNKIELNFKHFKGYLINLLPW